jgi:hypothetical protein
MEPPVSPNATASAFFYGPPERQRSNTESPSPQPARPLPIEDGSYDGHLAQDIRATILASRAGRLPRSRAKTAKRGARTFTAVLASAMILATIASGASASGKGQDLSCTVSPDPVASDTTVTISGRTGGGGSWVNAYIYYSDGYWGFMGGSVSGGRFSLSGLAQETHTSYWGPFYPASTGPASVQIYAGTANKNMGMVETCSFSVS